LRDALDDARQEATAELKESRDASTGVLETSGQAVETPALKTNNEKEK
jgi:hypothetical protein